MVVRLERPEGALAYEVQGEGPLVVCAHGMGDLRQQYRKLVPALVGAGYRVAALDLRGHGESDATFPTYAPEAVGADLLALVEAESEGPAVLIGNSAAGASAVWAAAEAPERFSELVLLGPVVRDAQGPMPAWLQRSLGRLISGPWGRWIWLRYYRSLYKGGIPDDHGEHLARLREALGDRRRLRAVWDTGTLSKASCADRVSEVRARSLAILGSLDPDYADPQEEAAWLRQALGAEVDVFEGVGHYPHLEQAERTAARVVDFLGEGR